ncbi:hypothetical protein H696_00716 [Fonticula alba]|uniref:Post-SET domain-containing protein n=1 Tax=Fonticula alba TaxID=691883 RepID=A0A058ZGW0_FONAL|nr:hypothetical protein H696_00716 [Fonticula alba]KCV73173.1 hypothetical protein H696_00716 [Fonticula alba]|eukprot:XP_009492874.1 hypothetical protein H696_00716 [Fonticula alba]
MARFLNHSCDPNAFAKVHFDTSTSAAPFVGSYADAQGHAAGGAGGNSDDAGGHPSQSSTPGFSIDSPGVVRSFGEMVQLGGRPGATERIFFHAKRAIAVGQEITFDYQFPLEDELEERVPCLCGSPNCRGTLN